MGMTFQELKQAAENIADSQQITIEDARKVVGYYNSEKLPELQAVVSGDCSSVPAVMDLLGIGRKKNSIENFIDNAQADTIPPNTLPVTITEDIQQWIDDYCQLYDVDSTKIDARQWKAVCIYIGEHIKASGILHDKLREQTEGGIRYNPETVAALLPIFEFICATYKQTAFTYLFPRFAGVGRNYFNDYEHRLTSSRVRLAKKAREIQRESIISSISSGGSNTVANIFLGKSLEGLVEGTAQPMTQDSQENTSVQLPYFENSQLLTVSGSES